MGVDWIPCRVEAGCSQEELGELVRREAIRFRISGSSIASRLDPRIQFSEVEQDRIRQAYHELGPLHRRLLFKRESHRISVITEHALFPVEWRIDAERTILPWELGDQLARWQGYRAEVKQGRHRPFLQQLYNYHCLSELVDVDLDNFEYVVKRSLTASGSWTKRPEVAACRDEILAAPILTPPIPPQWPVGGEESDLTAVERSFAKVESMINAWNHAIQRGNYKLRPPKRPVPFEQWIAAHLNDDWYSSFLVWVEPWKSGGYGLYRDCE